MIDIGTNSVKLLVAIVQGSLVEPILETSEQTRLGRGFYETRVLQPGPIRRTVSAVAKYVALAHEHEASSVRVVATSAARDARNASQLLDAIRRASGLRAEIIPGDQEAKWVFRGVCSDARLAGRPVLILDVGGGSTEMILGTASGPSFQRSFPLGSVRLLEQLTPADPPTPENLASGRAWLREFLKTEVRPVLAQALAAFQSAPIQLIGTGGTVTILSRMLLGQINFDRLAMEATPIRRDYIGSQTERLWSLSMADRRRIPGLPANRADVILTGIAIYEAIMNEFNFEELTVSTRGLRFGALLEGISVPAQP